MIDLPHLFAAKKVLTALVLPPAGPFLLILTGLALLQHLPRLGRALAAFGVLLLVSLSLPVVSVALLRLLDDAPPLDLKRASAAQAIVITGGGLRRDAPEYGGDTLGRLTLERVRYGAFIARRTGLPVLVTGGAVIDGPPEAQLMKRTLEEEFRIAVRWSEDQSRNTHENAVDSAAMLLPQNVRRVLLVAHDFDMPRASAEFAAAGFEVIAAPTYLPRWKFDTPMDLLPSANALQASHWAIYELLAHASRSLGI